MSLPKKKSRTVSVGDKEYRYLIKPMKGFYNGSLEEKELTLVVQEDCKNPGNPLIVSLSNIKISPWSIIGEKGGIGPGDVRKIVQKATDMGWVPSKKGPGFMPKGAIEIVREEQKKTESIIPGRIDCWDPRRDV